MVSLSFSPDQEGPSGPDVWQKKSIALTVTLFTMAKLTEL